MTDMFDFYDIGFEVEFIAPVGTVKTYTDVKENFESNFLVPLKICEPKTKTESWALTYDTSIKSTLDEFLPIELVSPPMRASEATKSLKEVFKWISSNGFFTNGSCGCHINISFQSIPRLSPITIGNLIHLSYEDTWRRRWPRTKRHGVDHVKPLKPLLKKIAEEYLLESGGSEYTPLRTTNHSCGTFVVLKLLDTLMHDKGYTIDPNKAYSRDYCEFRSIGGKNYHKRVDDVMLTVSEFIEVYHKALFNKKILYLR